MHRSVRFASAFACAATLLGGFAPGPAQATRVSTRSDPPPLVNEPFTEASADAGFAGYGTACLTGAAPAAVAPPTGEHALGGCYTPTNVGPVPPDDAAPHGYLRLTDAAVDQSAAVLYTRPLPANEGLRVSFDQWQYGGSPDIPGQSRPADGISFFLVDGAGTLSAPGAFGGSLGYAQKLPDDNPANPFLPGVNHGYIGLGLDVLGNYFGDWERRGDGCATRSPAGTVFRVPAPGPNVITLRGPGNGTDGYCWLAATAPSSTTGPWPSTLHGQLQGETTSVSSDPVQAEADLDPSRRRVTVEITPAPDPVMTVFVDYNDGNGAHLEMQTKLPQPVPETYKFGFAASTGLFTDVHLLRNVAVTPYYDLPRLNLVKQLDLDNPPPNPITVGSKIHYQFVATNSGQSPLTDLQVHDQLVSPVLCPDTSLQPGQSVTCTGTYTVTVEDVRDGYVHNTAYATSLDPDGATVRSPDAEFEVLIASDEALELFKKVDDSRPYAPGETVTYSYYVENPTDRTITGLAVHDDRVTGITCEDTTLTPAGTTGAATTCTGHYLVTEADAQNGHVANTAHATGVADEVAVLSPPDSAEIRVEVPAVSLALVKKADDSRAHRPGETVTYTYEVANTSHITVTDLAIDDNRVTGITCQATTLTPTGTTGDSTTCTGHYLVTEADAQTGHVTNIAHAIGIAAGTTVTSPDARAEIRAEVTPTPTPTTPTPKPTPTKPCPCPTRTGTMPKTGADIGGLMWLGAAALAVGALLLADTRRRRVGRHG